MVEMSGLRSGLRPEEAGSFCVGVVGPGKEIEIMIDRQIASKETKTL